MIHIYHLLLNYNRIEQKKSVLQQQSQYLHITTQKMNDRGLKIQTIPEPTILPQPLSPTQTPNLVNYRMMKTLGSGTFGKVKLAIHIPSGQQVAIKIIDKRTIKDDDDRQRVERQVQIMRIIRHPNIIQFYQKIQTQTCIYLVVQYAENGQLFKLMSEQNRINERAAGRIFIQLMNAVQYMHRLDIAHRDLKPQNILLDTDYNIKLIDFGLSNFSEKGQYLHTACGSPCYAPPQMVSGNSYEGQIGDVWSMGIIFYGMICGNLPFQQNTTKQLYKRVIQGIYHIPSYITLQATQVIRKMLVTNPVERITIPQLRKLTFFRNLQQIEPKIIGIIVGFHPMPIDSQIIQKMHKIFIKSQANKFDKQMIQDQIKENEHTQHTTFYYLLQKQSLRNGGKTVIDLQYFLESSEKYKEQYGILPANFQRQQSNETIKTVKNLNLVAKNKYSIQNKGLSQGKRQPISIHKRPKTQWYQNSAMKTQRRQKIDKPENLLQSTKKYKFEKSSRSKKNIQQKIQNMEKTRHMKTVGSQQKQRSKDRNNKRKEAVYSSTSRKKSNKKVKIENSKKLALNLWNAYFEKPIQSSARVSRQPTSSRGFKLQKKQKQKQDKIFNNNLQKLKQGFLRLPIMKKSRNIQETKMQQDSQNNSNRKQKNSS